MELAECVHAEILLLAVARPPEPATSVELEAMLNDGESITHRILRGLRSAPEIAN